MRNKDMTMDKARESLHIALDNCHEAARNYVEQFGHDEATLANMISSNGATWSGGYTSMNNIMETYIREMAIAELGKMLRKKRLAAANS